MPRPRSDDKRAAIMAAATQVIAVQGLTAATAAIAKEAGVSNGSLFTYFDTKTHLLNELYLELKSDMGAAALASLSDAAGASAREQLRGMWFGWLHWATSQPAKRRALAQLSVSDEITPATHQAAGQSMAGAAVLLERGRADGPLRDAPLMFVLALANSLAEATIDFILTDPQNADAHGAAGFDAFWRVLA